jgi:hypothetical protein
MLNLAAFMLGIALQGAAPTTVPVLSACDPSSESIAQVPLDAAMEVHYSIAGAPSCYQVTLTANGNAVRGYVFDPRLDALVAFEKSRLQTEQTAFRTPPPVPASQATPPKTVIADAKPAPEKKPVRKGPKVSM